MFDKFQPFQRLQMQNFSFTPNKYEIWERGKMTKNGKNCSGQPHGAVIFKQNP